MNFVKFVKLLAASFTLAVLCRYGAVSYESYRQDKLASEACNYVGLPLATGALRDAYEGLLGALHRAGESAACVSLTDNGRSYSPECLKTNVPYNTVLCKSEANSGVRAAISFEQTNLFGWGLALIWAIIAALVVGALYFSKVATSFLTKAFSDEVRQLLHFESPASSERGRLTSWMLQKTGIAQTLSAQAVNFRTQLTEFDLKAKTEAMNREHLEREAKISHEFFEKVRQIRHDIRSPLSSLQAVFERMDTDDKSKKVLATAIRRTQLLIDDLDEVDRKVETLKLVIAEVAIKETVTMLRSKFSQSKSAALRIEYDRNELSPIQVGPKGFQSVIENLIENALDAISAGGNVLVKVSRELGQCRIDIEDDGCGISPDNLKNLFSRGATFGKINGIGLGLYHSKKFVESWTGRIECERLSEGTRFSVWVPLLQTGVTFVGLPPKGRVKIIDDEPSVPTVLKNAGYEITEYAKTFDTGRELLAKVQVDEVPVLVDFRLDNGNFGTELIAEHPSRTEVFLCTNDFDELSLIRTAKQLGVKILPKPLCFLTDSQG